MYTEVTPNPLALKFVLESPVVLKGEYIFSSEKEAESRPVLQELLSLPGIHSVFISNTFLTVTKTPEITWSLLESIILSILHHHLKDFPLSLEEKVVSEKISFERFSGWVPPTEEVRVLCREIEDLLDGHVRPAIAEDGGAISLVAFEEGTVYVHLQGACDGCGHAQETLKNGVEQTLRYYIPEVECVESI